MLWLWLHLRQGDEDTLTCAAVAQGQGGRIRGGPPSVRCGSKFPHIPSELDQFRQTSTSPPKVII